MTGNELIINFEEDKAFLNEKRILSFQQLELPISAKWFKAPAFWKIKVLKYFPEERRIFAEILSYHTGQQAFPDYQNSEHSEINNINKITFRSIDTNGLLLTISGKESSSPIFPSNEKVPDREERTQTNTSLPIQLEADPQFKTIYETFYIPLKKVRFKCGCVAIDKRVSKLNKTLEFTVNNDEIREEFDAIKNYFANVLKVKKIKFQIEIQLIDGEIISIETVSPEIARINQEVIESVKLDIVKQLPKTKIDIEMDKSLFTMDEFFTILTDDQVKANVFYKDENLLFNDLLNITNSKHYNHLRFLSSKHVKEIMKLRFVIKPFSFIFLFEGKLNYHIIWESLDTEEATYIWHEEKNLVEFRNALSRVDEIINLIKSQGKLAYINTTKDNFTRIYHDYSEPVDGFMKWKSELETILT